MKTRTLKTATLIAALAAASPAWPVSMKATGPAQTLPDPAASAVSQPLAENLAAGSTSLIPVMAAELPATPASSVDASQQTGGSDVGKPIDDISFAARATENARKESTAARDALPHLQDPALKRMAEMLVKDHDDASTRLAKLAEAKQWPLPGLQRHDPPPSGTAIPDFDERFTYDMIAAHERSVALYSAQAQGGEDADLRKYARDTLPTIQHHLAELRRLQK